VPPRWRSWQQSALRSCHRASMIGLACFDAVGGDVAVAVVVDHRIERMGVDERGAVAKFGGERPGNCFCSYCTLAGDWKCRSAAPRLMLFTRKAEGAREDCYFEP